MVRFIDTFTGLLEEADTFILSQFNSLLGTMLDYQRLLQDLDDLQTKSYTIRTMTPQEAANKLRMVPVDEASKLNLDIEEHVFMYNDQTFEEQYDFINGAQGFQAVTRHLFTLLTDCAMLQIMYSAYTEKGLPPSRRTLLDQIDVERRAFWHASELCRCVYFYSQRSLTAARFLYALICSAQNFFESYGAESELDWCNGCVLAIQMRIERLAPTAQPTLCRLDDVVADLARGCRYGPQWQLVVEQSIA